MGHRGSATLPAKIKKAAQYMEFLSGLNWFNPVSFIPFIVVISVIVVFHELGHYGVARLFGVKVDSFSVGFGPELFGWTARTGTRWKLCALPLGGYVKFAGDAGPASIPDRETRAALIEGGQLSADDRALFHFKPLGQRAAIVAAGPLANFILAIVLITGLLWIAGERVAPPVLGTPEPDSPAAAVGLQAGDRVLSINGAGVERYAELRQAELINPGTALTLEVQRETDVFTRTVTPLLEEQSDGVGGTMRGGYLGFTPYFPARVGVVAEGTAADAAGLQYGDEILAINGTEVNHFEALSGIVQSLPGEEVVLRIRREGSVFTQPVTLGTRDVPVLGGGTETVGYLGLGPASISSRLDYSLPAAAGRGVERTGELVGITFKFLGDLITGRQAAEQVGGPVRIAKMSRDAASFGIETLVAFIALVSVGVGLINLFPIPVLDGGHLLYYAYEGVAGKPLGPQAQEVGYRVGLALVLTLAVVVTFNDLLQLNVFKSLGGLF